MLPLEQQIHSLEGYTAEELDEKWLYELAERYHEVGDIERCVSTCDKIMLMFGLGKYVDKAMDLKQEYAALKSISDGSGGEQRKIRREAAGSRAVF